MLGTTNTSKYMHVLHNLKFITFTSVTQRVKLSYAKRGHVPPTLKILQTLSIYQSLLNPFQKKV
jgi:hypothetical protein